MDDQSSSFPDRPPEPQSGASEQPRVRNSAWIRWLPLLILIIAIVSVLLSLAYLLGTIFGHSSVTDERAIESGISALAVVLTSLVCIRENRLTGKGRRIVIASLVLGCAGIILTVLFAIFNHPLVLKEADEKKCEDLANKYIMCIVENNLGGAYGMTSAGFRQKMSDEQFKTFWKARNNHRPHYSGTSYRGKEENGIVRVDLTVQYEKLFEAHEITFAKSGDGWLIEDDVIK